MDYLPPSPPRHDPEADRRMAMPPRPCDGVGAALRSIYTNDQDRAGREFAALLERLN